MNIIRAKTAGFCFGVDRAVKLTYDLLALGEIREVEGTAMFGVAAAGRFYPAVPASEIEGIQC